MCATDATRTLRRRYVVATRSARAFHVLARKCDFRDANNPDSNRTPRIYLHGFICSTATANHSWALWLKTLHLDAEPEHPSMQVREWRLRHGVSIQSNLLREVAVAVRGRSESLRVAGHHRGRSGSTLFHLLCNTYILAYIHTYITVLTYMHTYIHTHIHTYIHIYIHTYYIHTYIHTYILRVELVSYRILYYLELPGTTGRFAKCTSSNL